MEPCWEKAVSAIPGAMFTETDMREAVGDGGIAGRTHTARACIGALINAGQAVETGKPNVYDMGSVGAVVPKGRMWHKLNGQ